MPVGYPPGELRTALLRAGVAVVEEGQAMPGLREIARRVGVAPTATYRHFASKEALMVALVEAGLRDLADAFEAIPDRATEAGLIRIAGTCFDFALRRPAMFRLIFGGAVPLRASDGTPIPDPAWDVYLEAVAGLAGRPEDDAGVLEHAIRLWSCVHGFTMLALDERAVRAALDHDLLVKTVTPIVALMTEQ